MSRVFVDTSAWFALIQRTDAWHERSVQLLTIEHRHDLATSDLVLAEAWALTRSRQHRPVADDLVSMILEHALAEIIPASIQDFRAALRIGEAFSDQDFSLTDRTSWAVMERCGITEAVSFDSDFLVYRYGPHRNLAFTVHR